MAIIIASSTRADDIAPRSMVQTAQDIAAAIGATTDEILSAGPALVGTWNGKREHSRAIVTTGGTARDTHAMAYGLKVRLRQDAVMVIVPADSAESAFWLANGGTHADIYPVSGTDHDSTVQYDGTPLFPHIQNRTRWTAVPADGGAYVVTYV